MTLKGDLLKTYADCSQPDWDGHGAIPVSQQTYERVRDMLPFLPQNPMPTFGAEPDGCLTIEWYRAKHATVSLSVNETSAVIALTGAFIFPANDDGQLVGRLHAMMAGMFGTTKEETGGGQ